MDANRQAGMDGFIHGSRQAGQLASHFVKAGESCFHQMTQVSHTCGRGVIAQAVGEYEDDFAQGYISMQITEWSVL